MKFFLSRPFTGSTLDATTKYLRVDLAKTLSDLVKGLKHLSLRDNFDSFETTVTIAATTTAAIPNQLKSKTVKWWPVRITGDARLIEGDSGITEDFAYIKNASSIDTRATIVFMR